MGATGPTNVKPLKEEKAIEMGAEFIGEAFIYTVAISVVLLEYWRSSRKEAILEAEQDKDIDILKDKMKNMEDALKKIETRIKMLNTLVTIKTVNNDKLQIK